MKQRAHSLWSSLCPGTASRCWANPTAAASSLIAQAQTARQRACWGGTAPQLMALGRNTAGPVICACGNALEPHKTGLREAHSAAHLVEERWVLRQAAHQLGPRQQVAHARDAALQHGAAIQQGCVGGEHRLQLGLRAMAAW